MEGEQGAALLVAHQLIEKCAIELNQFVQSEKAQALPEPLFLQLDFLDRQLASADIELRRQVGKAEKAEDGDYSIVLPT